MWNKFLYRFCCLILGLEFSAQGLAVTYTPTWDELRQGLSEGKQESFNYLIRLKSHFEQIEEWDESIKGTYQSAVRLLSDFASKQGLYDFQEDLLLNALSSYQKRDSTNNSYSRDVLVSMTVLYNSKKDYDKVLKYGIEAIDKFQSANDFGLDYITLMHNLSNGALAIEDYDSANLFVQEGLRRLSPTIDTYESTNGYRLLCHLWNDYGRIAYRQGNMKSAEDYYTKCIEESLKCEFGSILRLARNNLAVLYIKQEKFEKALSLLEEVVNEHPSCENLLNLLHIRYRLSDKADSIVNKELTQYNNLRYSQSIHVINSSGEFERMMFLDAVTKEMIWNNNLIASRFPETTKEAFDANLFGRNISIGVNVALGNITRDDSTYASELANLRSQMFLKNISDEGRDSIYRQISQLEKELLSSSNTALRDEIDYVGSWDVIKETLTENDAILMFCYIPTIDNKSSLYGVYIGTHEVESPILIPLCEADNLEDVVLSISSDPLSISEFYQSSSEQIIDKIWEQIFPYIKGKNTIYYTPTGVLSLINIEAAKLKNGVRLDECFELRMCSSPTRIKDICSRNSTLSNISLFGAPNFNLDIKGMESMAEKSLTYSGIDIYDNLNNLEANLRSGWGELPETVFEISKVSSLTVDAGIKTLSYIGNEATEEQFKELSSSSPDIIHVASHGFSYSQAVEDIDLDSDGLNKWDEIYSVLQLSGLVLTGGNNVWQGKYIPNGVEDGILTAEEIARLDLSNTDLVVLSACDTGLGMIDPVDGVWGLQRAFKQAGVGSILMTLWKIPDNTTTMFMTEFYKQLLSGQTKHQSLKAAQNYLKANGASNPYYWASFILLDAN